MWRVCTKSRLTKLLLVCAGALLCAVINGCKSGGEQVPPSRLISKDEAVDFTPLEYERELGQLSNTCHLQIRLLDNQGTCFRERHEKAGDQSAIQGSPAA